MFKKQQPNNNPPPQKKPNKKNTNKETNTHTNKQSKQKQHISSSQPNNQKDPQPATRTVIEGINVESVEECKYRGTVLDDRLNRNVDTIQRNAVS